MELVSPSIRSLIQLEPNFTKNQYFSFDISHLLSQEPNHVPMRRNFADSRTEIERKFCNYMEIVCKEILLKK